MLPNHAPSKRRCPTRTLGILLAVCCQTAWCEHALCQELASPPARQTENTTRQSVERGLDYLAKTGQDDQGMFTAQAGPGITALALTAAMRHGRSVDDPMVAKGLEAMGRFIKPDGGIYGNGRLKNYETCVSMLCFESANTDGRYDEVLSRARQFVTAMQHNEASGSKRSDPWYGGATYGGSGRPDLSNTSYLIEALKSLDSGSDSTIQDALVFVSRCQNLDSKYNDTKFGPKVDDGGFYYSIPTETVDPSSSPERFTENGGLRSYGSMTYSGLKSMVYAGLDRDDPRVRAAVDWISKNYSVDTNPGMGTAGLYYYFHTFAAALDAAGLEKVTDDQGHDHDWRTDLASHLAKIQLADGSWANENGRWFENDKNLATSFALLALAHCDVEAPQGSGNDE